ncbi:MAG: hypothetical protein NT167_27585, partial [Verrucomicrobia bacterium]|nr:hypothetical protein [Verrucomicrobiota bacterium]
FALGYYTAEFRLWTAPQGGTAVWGKLYAFNVITNGEFNVILGDAGTELSPPITNVLAQAIINNTNPLYLAIVVKQTPSGAVASPHELAPRQQWVSSPYALKSTAANSTLAVGGISGFFDISGLDKARVPAGGMRMVGLSNNVVVYLPAIYVSNHWVIETNLTIASGMTANSSTVNLGGGLKTDVLGPTGGTMALTGPVRMFATNWTTVPFGIQQNPVNYDGWVMVQLPDLRWMLQPYNSDNNTYLDNSYSIWITVNGVSTKLMCVGVPAYETEFYERCLTYPIPANCSWRVYSNTNYPPGYPVAVYFLGLKGPL